MNIFFYAFVYSLSQIISVGVQNLFVINSGLAKEKNLFFICLIISIFDISLISLGVFATGALLLKNKTLFIAFKYAGSLFLFYYSFLHFRKFLKNNINTNDIKIRKENGSIRNTKILRIIKISFAVTYFNPNAIVDLLIILGSLSAKYINLIDKLYFYFGCCFASILWFFSLGYFSRRISHLFKSKLAWRILDLVTSIIMLIFAIKLLF